MKTTEINFLLFDVRDGFIVGEKIWKRFIGGEQSWDGYQMKIAQFIKIGSFRVQSQSLEKESWN